jgi:homoserine dehydrogenase
MRARDEEMQVSAPRDVAIALLGYGTVGSAVDRYFREHEDDVVRATGLRIRVAHALVRDLTKSRAYPPHPGVLTANFAEIRDDPSVVAVAELMGGLDPTGRYIDELLASGKPVATANKQLLAQDATGLLGRVKAGGSVCGAIPVITALRSGLPPGGITKVSGIVNGTTNFLLTRIEEGASFDDALDEARDRHFVEADPSEDLSGADAGAKMAILATIAFGDRVALSDVQFEGVEHVDEARIRSAHGRGRALRLVGTATATSVRVRLTELCATHPLAQVTGADNGVVIEGEGFRRIVLQGPGAGGPETASAVVADLIELVR